MAEGRLYKNQTKFRLRLHTSQDITSCTASIKYEKPSRKTGVWNAAIESESSGIIYVDGGPATKFDEDGIWKIWAYVNFPGNLRAPGKAFKETIFLEGD